MTQKSASANLPHPPSPSPRAAELSFTSTMRGRCKGGPYTTRPSASPLSQDPMRTAEPIVRMHCPILRERFSGVEWGREWGNTSGRSAVRTPLACCLRKFGLHTGYILYVLADTPRRGTMGDCYVTGILGAVGLVPLRRICGGVGLVCWTAGTNRRD